MIRSRGAKGGVLLMYCSCSNFQSDGNRPLGQRSICVRWSASTSCDRGGICRHILQRPPRFSAALYNGHSAALFVFDASCMEDSLNKAAWCIAELKQTVGPNKFRLMPKLLVCSSPFELHTWQLTNVTSNSHFDFDGMHAAGCLANNCFWLISWTWELLLRK